MLLILFVPSSNFLKDSTLCVPKGATSAVYSGKDFYFFFSAYALYLRCVRQRRGQQRWVLFFQAKVVGL